MKLFTLILTILSSIQARSSGCDSRAWAQADTLQESIVYSYGLLDPNSINSLLEAEASMHGDTLYSSNTRIFKLSAKVSIVKRIFSNLENDCGDGLYKNEVQLRSLKITKNNQVYYFPSIYDVNNRNLGDANFLKERPSKKTMSETSKRIVPKFFKNILPYSGEYQSSSHYKLGFNKCFYIYIEPKTRWAEICGSKPAYPGDYPSIEIDICDGQIKSHRVHCYDGY